MSKISVKTANILSALILLTIITLVCSAIYITNLLNNDAKATDNTTNAVISTSNEAQSKQKKEEWNLRLVNEQNPLPEDFVIETSSLPNGLEVDSRIYENLTLLLNDAKEQGFEMVVCSAYRSIDYQNELFAKEVMSYMSQGYSPSGALNMAKTAVAIPGTSEHNSGLAIDIVPLSHQTLDEAVEQTEEIKWLMENCQNYGFILRYPKGKSQVTGIIYEPWHYRYVGVEAAKEIMQKGITLEEYLNLSE